MAPKKLSMKILSPKTPSPKVTKTVGPKSAKPASPKDSKTGKIKKNVTKDPKTEVDGEIETEGTKEKNKIQQQADLNAKVKQFREEMEKKGISSTDKETLVAEMRAFFIPTLIRHSDTC